MSETTGTYLHLQRLSTEDGPGIRTTVFLKGCSLRCQWCHNPESLLPSTQVQRIETRCLHCGLCLQVCPRSALNPGDDFVHLDRARCDACGLCVQECPAGAWELLGIRVGVEELLRELLKDRSYFAASGGGVTFSGGEPALQADFCAELMVRLRKMGIHTALDTCGMVPWQNLARILPHTDLVLFDLKLMDPVLHQAFTGSHNRVILENLRRAGQFLRHQTGTSHLWVRTPLIPGATASQENLEAVGSFLASELGDIVERWELCAFNNLCRDKYRRLGLQWVYAAAPLLTQSELTRLETWAQASGLPPERVLATGAVQAAA